MAQYIKQGNIFGRIGSGIGKGLAEQVPKEIENYRLRTGLQNLANESDQGNLSPAQFLARASGTYGATPQMIQSFGELAKIQNQRNAYANASRGGVSNQNANDLRSSANIERQQQSNDMNQNMVPGSSMQQAFSAAQNQGNNLLPSEKVHSAQQTRGINKSENIPSTTSSNPLSPETQARLPWTPQQRSETINEYTKMGFLPEQAQQMAADDERRELAEPEVHRQRLKDIEEGKTQAKNKLDEYLGKKLQKTGEGIYKDIDGTMLKNAERGMIRDLIENPRADIENVANDWSERLKETAITKDKLRTFGKTTGKEALIKGDKPTKQLREYQDIFRRSGNLEEFNNMLQSELGLSKQGSASVAYPPRQKIRSIIDQYKPPTSKSGRFAPRPPSPEERSTSARRAALSVAEHIGENDSINALARSFSEKDASFDQQAFFDQLSEDKDRLQLNARQRLELAEGTPDIISNWGDIQFLPIFRSWFK